MRSHPNHVALVAFALAFCALTTSARAVWTTMVNNGPSSNRIDMIFLGDGYRTVDLPTVYPAHINNLLNHMFNESEQPFVRYKNFFNVHRVDVVSNQTGADVAPEGIFRDTALDARYYFDGTTERLLSINNTKANNALNTAMSGASFGVEMRFLTVNDSKYGGAGGTWPVYAGANTSATEIALHELGHSFAGLADHYTDAANTGVYGGNEPSEPDVSKNSTGAKWSQWLGYNQPGVGVIGAYEGARYWSRGLYRPSNDSKMRSLGRPFDAVAREQFILDFYDLVNPLDDWTPTAFTLVDPVLLADTIDPGVINLEWIVDGVTISGATSELFDPKALGIAPGSHSVRVKAFDNTDWVRLNRSTLEQTVLWSVVITPEPGTMSLLTLLAFALKRRIR